MIPLIKLDLNIFISHITDILNLHGCYRSIIWINTNVLAEARSRYYEIDSFAA